jgi:hypothetical protein
MVFLSVCLSGRGRERGNEILICFVFCVVSCVAEVLFVCDPDVVATASSQLRGLAFLSSAENLQPRKPSMKNSASFFSSFFSLHLTLVLVVFFFFWSFLVDLVCGFDR